MAFTTVNSAELVLMVLVLTTLRLTEVLARVLVVMTVMLEVAADLPTNGYPRIRLVLRDEVLFETMENQILVEFAILM